MTTYIQLLTFRSGEYTAKEDLVSTVFPLDRVIQMIEYSENIWNIYLDVHSDPNLVSRLWVPTDVMKALLWELRIMPSYAQFREIIPGEPYVHQ